MPKLTITHPSHPTMELYHWFTTDDGWSYGTYDLGYDDRRKWNHYAIKGDECLEVDWTPYRRMEREDLALWLALGRPGRQGGRALNETDLKHLATCRLRRAA